MAHVFISYHKDSSKVYANQLADHLIASGFDVWIDDLIEYGTNWEKVIFKAVDDCGAQIVIMTPGAYGSAWVQAERLYAQKVNKPVFPVLFRGDIFPAYLGSQSADVSSGQMPPNDFLDALAAAGVSRQDTPGRNIAEEVPNAVGSPKLTTNPPPPIPTPVDPPTSSPLVRRIAYVAALALIAALAFLAFDRFGQSQNDNTITPTITLSETELVIVPTVVSSIPPTNAPLTATSMPTAAATKNRTPTRTAQPTATLLPSPMPTSLVRVAFSPSNDCAFDFEALRQRISANNDAQLLADDSADSDLSIGSLCDDGFRLVFQLNRELAPDQGFDLTTLAISNHTNETYLPLVIDGAVDYLQGDYINAADNFGGAAAIAENNLERAELYILQGNSLRLLENRVTDAQDAYIAAAAVRTQYQWQAYNNLGLVFAEITYGYVIPFRQNQYVRASDGFQNAFTDAYAATSDHHQQTIIQTNLGMALVSTTIEHLTEGRRICESVIATDDGRDWLPAYSCVLGSYAADLRDGIPMDYTCQDADAPEIQMALNRLKEQIDTLGSDQPYALADAYYWLATYYQARLECNPLPTNVQRDFEVAREAACRARDEALSRQTALFWEDRLVCPGD